MNYWPMRIFQAGLWALAALVLFTYGYERYVSGLGWWALFYSVITTCAVWNSYRAIRGYVFWYGNPNNAKIGSAVQVVPDEPFELAVVTGLEGLTIYFEAEITNDEEKIK